MATTSIWKVEGWIGKVLGYAMNPDKTEAAPQEYEAHGIGEALLYVTNPDKTEQQLYVTGINCLPETSLAEMAATKRQYGKTGGIVAFHGYQSFAPGETTPAIAHEIGVALAKTLWEERFEVVVTTHLDKEHLHNHFVINSVSFADGKRFHRSTACYRAMREASDRLCREHQLSVIENPEPGRSKHYGEWRAEHDGKPTWRSLVKADIDEAIAQSTTRKRFFANLDALGYEVKTGKDISVRPPGKERFVRLARNFGEDYSYEGIDRRILANTMPKLEIKRTQKPANPPSKSRTPLPKGSIASLYRRYLFLFGGYATHTGNRRMHFLLREDLRHFDELASDLDLIVREGIDTLGDLKAYKANLTSRSSTLAHERTAIKRASRKSQEGVDKAGAERIADINDQLKTLRKEAASCKRIEERSAALPARIDAIERDSTPEKEESKHGRIRPSGRTTREDNTRR